MIKDDTPKVFFGTTVKEISAAKAGKAGLLCLHSQTLISPKTEVHILYISVLFGRYLLSKLSVLQFEQFGYGHDAGLATNIK